MKKLSPSLAERTFIPIRRKSLPMFKKKAKQVKMSQIDFMDFIVENAFGCPEVVAKLIHKR